MASATKSMTSGSIWKSMTFFAVPVFIGNLFQQMYNTVDSLIVGNYLGSSSLAAVSSSGSLIFMLIGFLGGISSGAGVVVARLFGARDIPNLQKAVHTIVAFGLVAGTAMTALGVWLSPYILTWMGTPASVMVESVAYLRVYFWGSLFSVMYNIMVGILQAVGNSKYPLYYLIASSIINLVLDIVFIRFVHTGVAGAALATVISQMFSAALCFWQLTQTQDVYKLHIRKIAFDGKLLWEIIRIGLPSGFQNSVIAFANVVVQSNVNSFGEMAMAGYGAYSKVEGFAFLPINSFTLALTTFVGQNLGAKKYDRVSKGVKFGASVAVILAELIGVVVFLCAPYFISAFDSNPEVVQFGIEKARTAALFYCLLAYAHSIASVLRGAGKAMVSMMIMLVFWCVVRVTFLSITIPITHSIQMVYWVYPLTWGLSCIAFTIYYRLSNWKGECTHQAEQPLVQQEQ